MPRKPRRHIPWPTLESREDALQRRLIELDRAVHRREYVAVIGLTEETELIREIGTARGDTGWHVHRPPRHAWEDAQWESWTCCVDLPTTWPPCCMVRGHQQWMALHGHDGP
jgi:hypothetical protein